jgi:hypothetical protein
MVSNVIEKMAEKTGKSEAYLKGLFTTEKKLLNEQFGDSLTEDKIDMLALIKVGKRYDIKRVDIDAFMNGNSPEDSMVYDPIDDIIIDDDLIDDISINDDMPVDDVIDKVKIAVKNGGKINEGIWVDFLATIPDPVVIKKTDYERTPSLILEVGPTYYLKMADLHEPPHPHEFDGIHGLYTKTAFKVILLKVSDEELYEMNYKKGFFEGKPAFVDGQKYTLWLDEKAVKFYKLFWQKVSDNGLPDYREFTFKWKKGKYNDWIFREVKKG